VVLGCIGFITPSTRLSLNAHDDVLLVHAVGGLWSPRTSINITFICDRC
jgi:hypothetical protein